MAEKINPAAAQQDAHEEFSLIPREKLIALYAGLLKCAAVRQRGARLKDKRNADDWAAIEAAGPAVCLDLRHDDLVILGASSERLRVAAGLNADATSSTRKVEERLPELIGKALAYRTQKDGKVAVAFWRDANQQPWLDAMEIARAHTLPIVFVCGPLSDASAKQVAGFATAHGTELPRITTDGHDPVAVYRVAHESIDRARRGRGATLIECGHFRVPGLRNTSDAVASMERYLRNKGMFKPALKRELTERILAEFR